MTDSKSSMCHLPPSDAIAEVTGDWVDSRGEYRESGPSRLKDEKKRRREMMVTLQCQC